MTKPVTLPPAPRPDASRVAVTLPAAAMAHAERLAAGRPVAEWIAALILAARPPGKTAAERQRESRARRASVTKSGSA